MTRDDAGRFDRSADSMLAEASPSRLAADDIADETADERSYDGPFGAYPYEAPRDFRTAEEIEEERRQAFGPACVGFC